MELAVDKIEDTAIEQKGSYRNLAKQTWFTSITIRYKAKVWQPQIHFFKINLTEFFK